MFTQVAVVPFDPGEVTLGQLLPIAAAIQVQVQRDLGPAWGLQAAVSAFPSLEQVPQGTWPVAVTNRADLPVDGFHFVMNGLPFGVVGNADDLSVVLSHEIAEMLVDPIGQRTITGPALTTAGQGPVDYLVEVCDPCEGETYQINGVDVSDFVVPAYYHADDMTRARSRGYSLTGAVSAPRQVRQGGYLSWREQFPSKSVFQAYGLAAPLSANLPVLKAASVSNPGAKDVNLAAGKPEVPEQLEILELPNSPTKAWRDLIAHLARDLDTTKSQSALSTTPGTTRGILFADTFRTNIRALLPVMNDQKPPPSIPEILAAIQDPHGTKTVGQTYLTNATVNADPKRTAKIVAYLKQQESVAGIFGPDIDSDLGMWMYVIMP